MNEKALEEVYKELASALAGRRLGAIFPLSRFETVIDFRLESGHFLFISIEPSDPRIYLIRRKMKDLAKTSLPLSSFHSLLRKHLTGFEVTSLSKLPGERVVELHFSGITEAGEVSQSELLIQ